jgi:uncharacterized protein
MRATGWTGARMNLRPPEEIAMRIHADQLQEGPLALSFEEPADWFPGLRDMAREGICEFTGPIQTRLRAARIREMVEVEGIVRTAARLTCGRCLTPFICPLEAEFALTYSGDRPGAPDTAEPEEKAMDASEAGLIYFRGEDIDLTEGVQEQVILAFPLRPLCREDCRGLCARCGSDLNLGDCRCPPAPVEGPFAALGQLKLSQ